MSTAMFHISKPTRIAQSGVITNIAHFLGFFLVSLRNNGALGYSKNHVCRKSRGTKPKSILFDKRKNFFVCNGIGVSNHKALFICLNYPCKELAE